MFAITKTEKCRRRYIRDVRELLAKTFDLTPDKMAHQDMIWNEWLESDKSAPSLYRLLTAKISDTYKARALAILLAPKQTFVPFAQGDYLAFHSDENYLPYNDSIEFGAFSEKFRTFFVELLFLSMDTAMTLSLPYALESYNKTIIEALKVFDKNSALAERLFERFEINDIIPRSCLEGTSGYNPFQTLLYRPEIPEKWKWLATGKMEAVIRLEQSGFQRPRAPWENARGCYAHIVMLSNHLSYSDELFAEQISYFLSFVENGISSLNRYHPSFSVFTRLSGKEHEDLRYRLLKKLINEKVGSLTVNDPATAMIADGLRKEFGKDPEILEFLATALRRYEERGIIERTKKIQEQEKLNAALNKLK
jgi:hypothetical protein